MSGVLSPYPMIRPAAGRLALALLAGVGAAGAAITLTACSAWLISRAALHPPVLHLMVAIVAVRACGLSRGVFRYLERLLGHDAAFRILGDVRVRLYTRLERLAPAGLADFRRADLAQRLAADVDAVLDLITRVVLPYAVALVVGLASVLVVGALVPAAGIALAAGLLTVAIGVPLLQRAAARRSDGRLAPLRGELATGVVDLLHGLPDLSAYGAEPTRLDRLAAVDNRLTAAGRRSAFVAGVSSGVTVLSSGLCVIVGLAAGAVGVRSGTLPGELLALVVLTPLAVFEVAGPLPAAAQVFEKARVSIRRLNELWAAPDPLVAAAPVLAAAPDPLTAAAPVLAAAPDPLATAAPVLAAALDPLAVPADPLAAAPVLAAAPEPLAAPVLAADASPVAVTDTGQPGITALGAHGVLLDPLRRTLPRWASVRFPRVDFGSDSHPNPAQNPDFAAVCEVGVRSAPEINTREVGWVPELRVESVTAGWVPGRTAVRDVDLVLPAGSRVALVGPSGSGKSTVAALLVRFLDPRAGRVTMDGIDLRDIPADRVRAVVGYLPEDAYLFDTTIGDNLRIAKPGADDAGMRAALRSARLLDWVETLPQGLDTLVGEHGMALSGGQRRRLALARLLLTDARVLILDEPTEHLDDDTAAALTRDLLEAAGDRTVLLITHRTDDLAGLEVTALAQPTPHRGG
jgi:ABC-type transport system involved in cytochrome bd biosynthesis fused ATPase/permease subunit